MSPVSLWAHLGLTARLVGADVLGNRYYQGKPRTGYKHPRRYVTYASGYDSSHVPPEWHGWLHHQTDVIPSAEGLSYRKPWQLPFVPNMTGTNLAYRPPGHQLQGGHRQKATGDYTPWQPSSSRKKTS